MALSITKTTETVKRNYSGVTLEIARANNRQFRDKFNKLRKSIASGSNRHRKKEGDEFSNLSAAEQDRILAKAYAGTILVGWSGFVHEEKKVLFTEENAEDLLFNDDLLRDFVAEEASDFDTFIQEEKEELVKKSPAPTSGA
ncbi:MAG: hypothetical protein DRQ62_15635 [Gammaproteobacteria bacterium]|nr:MAG: hypothetical protein DRQ62_15635 [Gammaproteobacteria bacterium]